jgi:4,5-dihydroxyphthalate decarboxylase
MHLISVRRDVLARAPSVGRTLYDAFCAAKCVAETECGATLASSSPATMVPFLAEEWAVMRALLGPAPWRYGVAASRTELEALCRWSHTRHLARRVLQVEELFDPATLDT